MTHFPLKSIQIKNKKKATPTPPSSLNTTHFWLSSPHQTAQSLSPLLRRCRDRCLPLPLALSLLSLSLKSNSTNPFLFNLILSSLIPHSLPSARNLFDQLPHRLPNHVTRTLLLDAHMKRGLVPEALRFFSPPHSVISSTAAISGLVRNSLPRPALSLFCRMLSLHSLLPNDLTLSSAAKACAALPAPSLGRSLLALATKTGFAHNVSVSNSLLTMFSRTGDADAARRIFDEMPERDVVSWTAMLDAEFESGDADAARRVFEAMPVRNEVSWSAMVARLGRSGEHEEALRAFVRMLCEGLAPNVSCLASMLSVSAACGRFAFGIHSLTVKLVSESDHFVASSLIDMYSKCGMSEDARRVFDSTPDKNVVVWNSMLGGYAFDGRVEDAEEIFRRIPDRNVVTWNAMISGYDTNENYSKVLETFDDMLASGQLPTRITFSSVLHSCANLPSLERGKNLHGKIVKLGLETQVFVGTALIDMYSKSGDVQSSKRAFFMMPEKNEVSWTAMIRGLADSGLAQESLDTFEELKTTTAIVPNETMFLAVLAACSHRGLVDEGLRYFKSMERDYGLSPGARHYTCLVNLLARAGLLQVAEEFIGRMPVEPEATTWAALLSGCCSYRNEEIGERAARKVMELGKGGSSGTAAGGYVLLSNVYASVGKWKEVAKVRRLMREAGVKKGGGCSWIHIRSQLHSFYSWDASNIESLEIYRILELLMYEMMET